MERQTREIKGEPIAWEEHGQGVPVVLVHGIPTGPSLWRQVVPLVEDARCLAFEMLGYADSMSSANSRDISLAAQAARLIRWLDALEIERAVLVGHDLGGGVAQIAAVDHPGRCSGLVLINAVSYDSWPIPSVKAIRAAGGIVAHTPNALFRGVLGGFIRLGHGDRRVASESVDVHWQPYARHEGAAGFVRQIRSLRTADTLAIADRLPSLDVPAQVVWGAADRFQKIRYGERLARDLRATLDRVDGARHFVPEDHPERVANAINAVAATAGP
jgi:pimeloyl-ACP methyl ester carboxylesterase